jgi:hypothetical protein
MWSVGISTASWAVVFSFDEKTRARRWTGPSRACRWSLVGPARSPTTSRHDQPFTVAESCRPNRLAQVAETALITQAASATPPKCRTRKAA